MGKKEPSSASAHPLRGSHDKCYYTVGSHNASMRARLISFQDVYHEQHKTQMPNSANANEAKRDRGRIRRGPLVHFCQFGIDKPIKDERNDDDVRQSETPQRQGYHLEKLFNPQRTFEDSIDPDTKRRRKVFEKHLRGFFVETQSRRQSLKKYGTFKEDEEEKVGWVVHPWSYLRLRWDLFIVIVSIISMVLIPIMIAFLDYFAWWYECFVLNLLLDIIFAFDIAFNFRTGFVERSGMHQKINVSPVSIQHEYLHGWFMVDVISTIPFDYTVPSIIQIMKFSVVGDDHLSLSTRLTTLGKFLGLLRLLRVCRLVRYMTKLQTSFSSSTQWASVRTLNMVLLMVLTAHWNGCLHFLVNSCLDFPERGWISMTGIKDSPWTSQYSWCLFNSISQMLCIGYGRMSPETLVDMWFTLWGMLSGSVGFCLIIAHIASVWQQMDAPRKLHRQKMAELEDYMSYKRFDPKLRSKIRDYYERRYHGRVFDEDNLLSCMSEPLRELVMRHNCQAMILSLPFLSSAEPAFVNELVTHLKSELYQPDDIIVANGTIGEKMYFIQSGEVTVVKHDGAVLASLHEGHYFGELSLLVKCERNATVRASTHCSCFTLEVNAFRQVLVHFPHIEASIKTLSRDIIQIRDRQSQDEPGSETAVSNMLGIRDETLIMMH